MDELAMRAFTKAAIHGTARERLALSALTRLATFDGPLQPPADFRVVEDLQPALPRDVADDLCHGREVVAAVQRQDVAAVLHKRIRAAAVLRWTGAVAGDTDGISLARLRCQQVLDADLVPPWNV